LRAAKSWLGVAGMALINDDFCPVAKGPPDWLYERLGRPSGRNQRMRV
jgi:hypothetical protein